MMNAKCGIYAVENLFQPRAYVGATKDSFDRRSYWHFTCLRNGDHPNDGLRQDVRRHGAEAFRFIVLQELPRSAKFAPFEQFWIDYLTRLGVQCYNVMRAYETVLYEMEASEVPSEYCYTMADVMARMKIGESTLYAKIRAGVIQPIGSRTRWHFSEENIQQLIHDCEQTRLRVRAMKHEEAIQRRGRKREQEQLAKDSPIC